MQLVESVIERYTRHLAEVFMFLPGTMRDAERVTAEETRMRAASLNQAHGGVYSMLGDNLQLPYARIILGEMGLADLESQGIKITIITGLDALSRGNENDKINHWISDLNQLQAVPPEILQGWDLNEFSKKTATGRDVDASWVLDPQQLQQKQAAMQKAQEQQVMGQEMAKKAEPEQLAAAMQQG